MRRITAALALLALFAAPACAQLTIEQAWVRATVPQQKVTGAYLRITAARDVRLVEARSAIAGSVEMHATTMSNNMMKMRPVASLDLPAGKTVEFKPGGYHIMLMDLKRPIKEGESVPLTLVVEGKDGKRESVEVQATVRPLTEHGGGHKGHGHKGH